MPRGLPLESKPLICRLCGKTWNGRWVEQKGRPICRNCAPLTKEEKERRKQAEEFAEANRRIFTPAYLKELEKSFREALEEVSS